MKTMSIFLAIGLGLLMFASPVSAKKPLGDQQMDLIAAGTVDDWHRGNILRVNDINGDRNIVDNRTDNSINTHFIKIEDSHIEVNAVLSLIGQDNILGTGLNVLAVIDKPDAGSGSGQGLSSGSLSGLQSINQVNYIFKRD